jgi:DNA repair protein RadC
MEAIQAYTVTEITVAYHPKKTKSSELPMITTSFDAVLHLMEGYNRDTMALQEQFVVMYLNRANKVLGIYRSAIGGLTGTIADPRLILATALKVAASSMILSHNHPSGNLKPSRQDEEITTKLKEGARFMDIKVLDHLILDYKGEYYSFADEGLL